MEGLITILIFVGVIAMTALIFSVWVISMIVRLIVRGMTAVIRPPALPPMPSVTGHRACINDRCRAANPTGARFCRRCGRDIQAQQSRHVGWAAVL